MEHVQLGSLHQNQPSGQNWPLELARRSLRWQGRRGAANHAIFTVLIMVGGLVSKGRLESAHIGSIRYF